MALDGLHNSTGFVATELTLILCVGEKTRNEPGNVEREVQKAHTDEL